jgi:spore maturation protein CgeB
MLAERTAEHLALFTEGVEAEFFGSKEELLEKCRFYLSRSGKREIIAGSGRQRCLRSGYSYEHHVDAVLSELRRLRGREGCNALGA